MFCSLQFYNCRLWLGQSLSISFQCLPHHWSILIHPAEVIDALLNLDTTKAMGSDGIPSIVLQRCATVLYQPLSHLFNLTLQCCYLPTEWKIHKVANTNLQIWWSKNYRPISLLSIASQVLECIIYNKMVDHVSATITSTQFGFMDNHSTTQQLFFGT